MTIFVTCNSSDYLVQPSDQAFPAVCCRGDSCSLQAGNYQLWNSRGVDAGEFVQLKLLSNSSFAMQYHIAGMFTIGLGPTIY